MECMPSVPRSGIIGLILLAATVIVPFASPARAVADTKSRSQRSTPILPPQETGFLNRTITLQGVTYKFQVYLPEEYRRPGPETISPDHTVKGKKPEEAAPVKQWPIILFLHGRGERGSEGLWQTQIGLPAQLRDHPERWPFIVVIPQCPLRHFWTDSEMLQMAKGTLDQESREFHADPERTYLMGLSLGGYGAWELAKLYPHRWAAIAIASSGIFWSYAPERWREVSTLPAEYAHRIGRVPIWLFHGTDDPVVVPRESELMYEAFKAEGGHIRLWDYQGLKHDCWTRAFNEPELPRWLLSHRLNAQGQPVHDSPTKPEAQLPAFSERIVVPLHPPALKLPPAILDSYVGVYHDSSNVPVATIQRQGDQLFLKNAQNEVYEIQAQSTSTFFYLTGSQSRLTFEHDPQGHVTSILFRDDRHEERWEKKK
jgi:dienelactone hydrolase